MKILRLEEIGVEIAAAEAAECLTRGEIVLYPTDTVYGLGVDAMTGEALSRLYALKEREVGKQTAVILGSVGHITEYAELVPEALALAEAHLPGKLMLILPAKSVVPHYLAPEGGLGIRVPDYSFTLELSKQFGRPYTTTSANLAGRPTGASLEEVLEGFGDKADMISLAIDGGLLNGAPSTVVGFARDKGILREGAISREELGM